MTFHQLKKQPLEIRNSEKLGWGIWKHSNAALRSASTQDSLIVTAMRAEKAFGRLRSQGRVFP